MDKETLIQNLKSRVGESDFGVLSERTIDSIVTPILPMFEDDSSLTDDSYTLPVNMIRSYIGQYRHDIAEGMKSGKTAWEAEQKSSLEKAVNEAVLKEREKWQSERPVETQTNTDTAVPTEDLDKKIEDKFNALISGLTGDDGAIGRLSKTVTTFINGFEANRKAEMVSKTKAGLTDYLLDMGADRMKVIELAVQGIEIDEKSDILDLQRKAKASYESLYKELYGDGGKPFAGGAGGSTDSADDFAAFIKERTDKAANAQRDAETLKGMML